jgi:type IV pilus modification protein PilV
MTSRPRPSFESRRHGFALFEVMAAMMVLSVSFLGTALLLAKTAREGRSAIFLSRAATLASEMAERMRVSPGAKAAYNLHADLSYAQAAGSVTVMGNCGGLFTVPGTAPTVLGDCTGPQQTAYYDVTTWINQIRYSLPGGTGFIFPPTVGRSTHIIAVAWMEPVVQTNTTGQVQSVNQKCNAIAGASLAAPDNVRCYVMEMQL